MRRPSVGGRAVESSTGLDQSTFHIDALAGRLPAVLEALGVVVTRPGFHKDDFERALRQQQDEAAISTRDVGWHLEATLTQHLFQHGDIAARPISGTTSTLRQIRLEQVRQHYTTHYRPNNTALIVVGDVEAARVIALSEQYFGTWSLPKGAVATAEPAPRLAALRGGRPIAALATGTTRAWVAFAFPGPGARHEDYLAFRFLGTALSGLALSRGNQALSHHDIKSYGVWHSVQSRPNFSLLFLQFAVEHYDLGDSIETLQEEAARLRQEPLTAPELARVRARYLLTLAEIEGRNAALADRLAMLYALGFGPREHQRRYSQINSVLAEDIQRVAQRWLTPENLQIGVIVRPSLAVGELDGLGKVQFYALQTETTEK